MIGADYDALEKLRMVLSEANASDQLIYVCPICGVGVYLSRIAQDRLFFFKHRPEDGNCPAITRGDISQEEIEARK